MKNIALKLNENVDRITAERSANARMRASGVKPLLLAWYDRELRTGGPTDVCGNERESCVLDYAYSHGADTAVTVNNSRFEFFFLQPPTDTIELDRDACLSIHHGSDSDVFDALQGG